MKIGYVYVLFNMSLGACVAPQHATHSKEQMKPQENFTVTGKAVNAKYSAAIQSDKGLYYVPQVGSWSDAEAGKQVAVTGTLYLRGDAPRPIDPKAPQSQEINGQFYTIEAATWKVVE